MSSRASRPLPPAACVPLLPLSPVAPSRFHPSASLSLPDNFPSSCVIHLALVQNSVCLSRSDFHYSSYFSLPPQRLLHLYRLYLFLFLTLKHCTTISLSSVASSTPTFLSYLFVLKQPCQQLSFFFFRFSFSSILDTPSRISLPDSPSLFLNIALLSSSPFVLPFFQHDFPPSTFLDSPLSCGVPLAVSPSSVTPTSYFSMPPYPRFVARCSYPRRGTTGGTCVRSTSIDLF